MSRATVPSNLSIDRPGRRASVDGGELYLNEREFTLLDALAAAAGQIVTYDQLLGEVFAGAAGMNRCLLDANAARLQRKLELRGALASIAACSGVGFRFVEFPEETESENPALSESPMAGAAR